MSSAGRHPRSSRRLADNLCTPRSRNEGIVRLRHVPSQYIFVTSRRPLLVVRCLTILIIAHSFSYNHQTQRQKGTTAMSKKYSFLTQSLMRENARADREKVARRDWISSCMWIHSGSIADHDVIVASNNRHSMHPRSNACRDVRARSVRCNRCRSFYHVAAEGVVFAQ
jgi:hypothetical protein